MSTPAWRPVRETAATTVTTAARVPVRLRRVTVRPTPTGPTTITSTTSLPAIKQKPERKSVKQPQQLQRAEFSFGRNPFDDTMSHDLKHFDARVYAAFEQRAAAPERGQTVRSRFVNVVMWLGVIAMLAGGGVLVHNAVTQPGETAGQQTKQATQSVEPSQTASTDASKPSSEPIKAEPVK